MDQVGVAIIDVDQGTPVVGKNEGSALAHPRCDTDDCSKGKPVADGSGGSAGAHPRCDTGDCSMAKCDTSLVAP